MADAVAPTPQLVNVVSPDGDAFSLPSHQLEEASAQGYRLETAHEAQARKEKEQYEDRPLAAGALGLADSATLGILPAVLKGAGVLNRRTAEKLPEYNAGAHLVGEGLGLATALIPGVG